MPGDLYPVVGDGEADGDLVQADLEVAMHSQTNIATEQGERTLCDGVATAGSDQR